MASLISGSLKGSAWRKEGLGATIDVEEEEELAEAGNQEGMAAGGAGPVKGDHPDKVRSKTGGAGPAKGDHPDKVRSEAEEVE